MRPPKTTTSSEAAMLANTPVCAPGTGFNHKKKNIKMTRTADPPTTTPMERSSSVRNGRAPPAPDFRRFAMLDFRAPTMVGMVLSSVISPDAATAPAPIGRT
jgi:hypothetical protein